MGELKDRRLYYNSVYVYIPKIHRMIEAAGHVAFV